MRDSDGHQDVIRMSYMTSWSSGDDVHTEAQLAEDGYSFMLRLRQIDISFM